MEHMAQVGGEPGCENTDTFSFQKDYEDQMKLETHSTPDMVKECQSFSNC